MYQHSRRDIICIGTLLLCYCYRCFFSPAHHLPLILTGFNSHRENLIVRSTSVSTLNWWPRHKNLAPYPFKFLVLIKHIHFFVLWWKTCFFLLPLGDMKTARDVHRFLYDAEAGTMTLLSFVKEQVPDPLLQRAARLVSWDCFLKGVKWHFPYLWSSLRFYPLPFHENVHFTFKILHFVTKKLEPES